ncbi:MAG: dihydroorotase [Gammaproteobacteria bacterium]|nr:dihydroorotase [Gammaproteobacteria bacterium]
MRGRSEDPVVKTVIKNARIVNEGSVIEGDLSIEAGRIARVGGEISDDGNVVDARGAFLLPGMIDDQVHFREPGFEHKGTIACESRAAVAGGITSYMEMPNCNPLTVTHEALDDKHHRAARVSLANYAFYFGATNDNLEAIKTVDPLKACGIKVFMGASTGNMLVDDEETLEGIFAGTALVIATHCEDTPTILENEARAKRRYGNDVPIEEHPLIRSEEACYKSSALATELAKRHGSRLHVLHLTTAKELELFDTGPIEGKRITAEVCVHHLCFNDGDYRTKGADIKCNPAIKKPSDQAALLKALVDDRIDVIATDHAPHTREEKDRSYFNAPAGLPLAQHALLSLMEHVRSGTLSIETVALKTAHAPALMFDVNARGFLREGYWADVVLVDPDARTIVDEEPVLSKCGWSPFSGTTFSSRITHTFVNGLPAYADGRIVEVGVAMALEFDR